jgi:putative membrane protein
VTAIRLAFLELGRFRGQPIRYAALAVVVLVPLLYGALYLWSNWDPYGRMDQVPVAVVNADEGATLQGKQLNAGDEFEKQLKDSPELDWNFVSGSRAKQGMKDGEFYFAIVVPADFSKKLATLAGTDPKRAYLAVDLDDANGYIVGMMAKTLEVKLQNQINTAVYVTFAKSIFGNLSELDDGLGKASDAAAALADGADQANAGAKKLNDGLTKLDDGANKVSDGVGTINDAVQDNAPALIGSLDTVQHGSQVGTDIVEALSGVDSNQLDDLCDKADNPPVCDDIKDSVSDAKRDKSDVERLNSTVQGLTADGISADAKKMQDLADGAQAVANGTGDAVDGSRKLADGTQKLSDGADKLSSKLADAAGQVPSMDAADNAKAADVLGSPVSIKERNANPAKVYGRGLAPFFIAIALWVFGLVAYIMLRVVNPRALAGRVSALTAALSGWLPALMLGILGSLVLYLVIDVALGLNPKSVAGTIGLCLLAITVFTAIAHFLRLALDAAGDVLILVFLMLQLTSSGGLYPLETAPAFFRFMHPLLPMSYLVDGLRVTISGGNVAHLWRDVAVLAAFGVAAVTASTLVAMRHRRWTMGRLRPAIGL